MANAVTTSAEEREAIVAIDYLVDALALRVGRMIPRRNDARYPLNAPLVMGHLREGGVFAEIGPAWGLDLGSQGLGMISDRAVPVGEQIHVKLRGIDGRHHLVPMRVTHTERLFGSVYRIGGRFLFDDAK